MDGKYYQFNSYIDGKFTMHEGVGGHFIEKINPSTLEKIGDVVVAGEDAINKAVSVARLAFPKWKAMSRVKRADYMLKIRNLVEQRKDELTEAISLEVGKSLNESRAEVTEAIHMLEYAFGTGKMPVGEVIESEIPEKDITVFRKPKGVVAIITPWNFPLAIIFWNMAPSLVEGNVCIVKPSEDSPFVGQLIAEIMHSADLPSGVFQMLHGDGSTGKLLVENEVAHICFTGSAEVGQFIRRACAESFNKSCSCEMGSKSAVIVGESANFNLAVDACLTSVSKLSGQRCVSASRLIVHRSLFQNFCNDFAFKFARLESGDPLKDSFDYGPLINSDAVAKVQSYNDMVMADDDCIKITMGMNRPKEGYFMGPLAYSCEWDNTKPFLVEEVFGPHVAVIPYDTIEEAVKIYNDTEYGLSCALISEDYREMRYVKNEADYGMFYVNLPGVGAESFCPFGGVKKSGNGWPSAARTYQSVTDEVVYTVNHSQEGFEMAQGLK